MADSRKDLGKEAEDRAASYLASHGYTLITRRWHGHHAELDLVAMDGETLVFVEVRARTGRLVAPEETITEGKLSRFKQSVEKYLRENGLESSAVRLDLVAVDENGLRHFPGALDRDYSPTGASDEDEEDPDGPSGFLSF